MVGSERIRSVVRRGNERGRQRTGGEIEYRHRPEIQNQLDGAQHGHLVVRRRICSSPARVRRQRQQHRAWSGRIHREDRGLRPEPAFRYGFYDPSKRRVARRRASSSDSASCPGRFELLQVVEKRLRIRSAIFHVRDVQQRWILDPGALHSVIDEHPIVAHGQARRQRVAPQVAGGRQVGRLAAFETVVAQASRGEARSLTFL